MTQPVGMGRASFPQFGSGHSSLSGPAAKISASPSSSSLNQGLDARSAPISSEKSKPVVDRSKVDPEIVRAAEGMEAMFLDYMMKVMRQTVPKNEMDLQSPATEVYQGMLDSEYAEKAAHQGGIGLADEVIAYLELKRSPGYNLPQGRKEKP